MCEYIERQTFKTLKTGKILNTIMKDENSKRENKEKKDKFQYRKTMKKIELK